MCQLLPNVLARCPKNQKCMGLCISRPTINQSTHRVTVRLRNYYRMAADGA